jgi:hypothetical protein
MHGDDRAARRFQAKSAADEDTGCARFAGASSTLWRWRSTTSIPRDASRDPRAVTRTNPKTSHDCRRERLRDNALLFGKFRLEPPRNLLPRPIQSQFVCYEGSKSDIDRQVALLGTRPLVPCFVIGAGSAILTSAAIFPDFAADR